MKIENKRPYLNTGTRMKISIVSFLIFLPAKFPHLVIYLFFFFTNERKICPGKVPLLALPRPGRQGWRGRNLFKRIEADGIGWKKLVCMPSAWRRAGGREACHFVLPLCISSLGQTDGQASKQTVSQSFDAASPFPSRPQFPRVTPQRVIAGEISPRWKLPLWPQLVFLWTLYYVFSYYHYYHNHHNHCYYNKEYPGFHSHSHFLYIIISPFFLFLYLGCLSAC